MTALLAASDIKKSFSDKPLLRIDELQLNAGDIVLLRGDNGAGKTTLLRILAGLLPPDSCGKFIFNGKAQAAPPQAAYLHQTPYLFSSSVRANVEYGTRRCNLPLSNATDAMQWAGIAHLADAPCATLSGGERRRVALARIRALRPKLYLLDEPTAHLDADGGARVRDLLSDLRAENATALISTHENLPAATAEWTLANGDITKKLI